MAMNLESLEALSSTSMCPTYQKGKGGAARRYICIYICIHISYVFRDGVANIRDALLSAIVHASSHAVYTSALVLATSNQCVDDLPM